MEWSNPAFRQAYYKQHRARIQSNKKLRTAIQSRRTNKRSRLDQLIMGMGDLPHEFGVFAELPGIGYVHNGRRVFNGYTL